MDSHDMRRFGVSLIALVILTALVALNASCRTPSIPMRLDTAPIGVDSGMAERMSELQDLSAQMNRRNIWIEGPEQVVLPQTPGRDEAPRSEEYEFYVYVNLNALLADDAAIARDHVAAAQAEGSLSAYEAWKNNRFQLDVLGVPARIEPVTYAQAADGSDPAGSRNALRVVVRSQDLNRPFTIAAWNTSRYRTAEARRADRIKELVARYDNPGAHVPVLLTDQRLSSREVEALEAQHQQDTAKKIQTVLEQPNPWGAIHDVDVLNGDLFTRVDMLSKDEVRDAFGNSFEEAFFVGRVYLRNPSTDKKLVVNTTSIRADCLFYRFPNARAARTRYAMEGIPRLTLLRAQAYLDGLSRATENDYDDQDLAAIIEWAIAQSGYSARSDLPEPGKTSRSDRIDPVDQERQDIIWELSRKIRDDIDGLFYTNDIPPQSTFAELLNDYFRDTRYASPPDVNLLFTPADVILRFRAVIQEAQLLKDSWYSGTFISESQKQDYFGNDTPFGRLEGGRIGPTDKPIGYSDNIIGELTLLETGVLFRDYYRPLTFNSVLISLIRKTETSLTARVMDTLESFGVVAGALVGVGALTSVFTDDIFVNSVAISTGVVLPEARKLLLDDLNQFITNMGTLGLDTVVEIEPQSVVDGYVFFPRGPIFGFGVTDFDLASPSFIVNIDNANVAVDALLVDKGVEITGGQKTQALAAASGRLEAKEREYDKRLQESAAKFRTFRLATLDEEVDRALETDGTEAPGPDEIEAARRVIRSYTATFGEQDPSGTLARIQSRIDKLDRDVKAASPARLEVGFRKDGVVVPLKTVTLDGTGESPNRAVGAYEVHLPRRIAGAQAMVAIEPVDNSGEPVPGVMLRVTPLRGDSAGWLREPARASLVLPFANERRDREGTNLWSEPYRVEVAVTPALVPVPVAPMSFVLRHMIATSDSGLAGQFELPAMVPVTPERFFAEAEAVRDAATTAATATRPNPISNAQDALDDKEHTDLDSWQSVAGELQRVALLVQPSKPDSDLADSKAITDAAKALSIAKGAHLTDIAAHLGTLQAGKAALKPLKTAADEMEAAATQRLSDSDAGIVVEIKDDTMSAQIGSTSARQLLALRDALDAAIQMADSWDDDVSTYMRQEQAKLYLEEHTPFTVSLEQSGDDRAPIRITPHEWTLIEVVAVLRGLEEPAPLRKRDHAWILDGDLLGEILPSGEGSFTIVMSGPKGVLGEPFEYTRVIDIAPQPSPSHDPEPTDPDPTPEGPIAPSPGTPEPSVAPDDPVE